MKSLVDRLRSLFTSASNRLPEAEAQLEQASRSKGATVAAVAVGLLLARGVRRLVTGR